MSPDLASALARETVDAIRRATAPIVARINATNQTMADAVAKFMGETATLRSAVIEVDERRGNLAGDVGRQLHALEERVAALVQTAQTLTAGVAAEAAARESGFAALREVVAGVVGQTGTAAGEASRRLAALEAGAVEAAQAAQKASEGLAGVGEALRALEAGLGAFVDARLAAGEARQAERIDAAVAGALETLRGEVATLRGPPGEGFRYRDVFDPHAEYAVGDWVTHDGTLWAARAESKGLTPGTDAAAASWRMALKRARDGANGIGMNWRGVFAAGETYRVNEVVRHFGRVFVCRRATSNPPPIPGGAAASEWAVMLEA